MILMVLRKTIFLKNYINSSEKLNPEIEKILLVFNLKYGVRLLKVRIYLTICLCQILLFFLKRHGQMIPKWMTISDQELRRKTLQKEWNNFANNIGQRLLPIVDNIFDGLKYDLPKPGGVIINDSLFANSAFPGLNIKYTLDGSIPNSESMNYPHHLR